LTAQIEPMNNKMILYFLFIKCFVIDITYSLLVHYLALYFIFLKYLIKNCILRYG
jgi:hypothetical protein